MKIAVIHSIYKPDTRGGAEVVVENIVQGLKSANHDTFVMATGYKNKMEMVDDVRVYRIKPFNLFNFLDINSKPIWLRLPWHIIDTLNDLQTWRVYKVLKSEKPDLILTNSLKGLGYYIPWLIKIMKIKLIHIVHDMQLIHPSGLLRDNQKIIFPVSIYTRICKKLFRHVEIVVYPSKYIKDVYDRFGFFEQAKKIVLGNPILIVNNLSDHNRSCKKNNGVDLLYLGQVEKYKGITDLVEALLEAKYSFRLHVVGDGSALAMVKKMVVGDNRFIFYGRLSQSDLATKIWPLMDLLINPTRVPESFGMVVLEAMASGVPTLASKIGAIPELIEDGRNGWLFEANDITELGHKIEHISKHLCGFEAIRLIAKEEAKKFELENYIKKILELSK